MIFTWLAVLGCSEMTAKSFLSILFYLPLNIEWLRLLGPYKRELQKEIFVSGLLFRSIAQNHLTRILSTLDRLGYQAVEGARLTEYGRGFIYTHYNISDNQRLIQHS